MKRIYLWTNNRSLGTVFLKCLSNIPNCQIINGIFTSCFFYGADPGSQLPPASKEIARRDAQKLNPQDFELIYDGSGSTYEWAKAQLECDYQGKEFLICKDLSFALSGNHEFIPHGFRHTFLIRHPYRVFSSWKRNLSYNMPHSRLEEIINNFYKRQFNFREQFELLKYLKTKPQLGDTQPVIIDADDLLRNPEKVLMEYCSAVGLPFSSELLRWKPGIGAARYWKISRELMAGGLYANGRGFYKKAFESSRFLPSARLPQWDELDQDVRACAERGMPYYQKMYDLRTIRP